MSKGRTAGSVSFAQVKLSELLKLRPDATVLVNRRFAESLNLANVATAVTPDVLRNALKSARIQPVVEVAAPAATETVAPQISVE